LTKRKLAEYDMGAGERGGLLMVGGEESNGERKRVRWRWK
jgi:hypothetical protein